jgi:alkaline phosphatase D
MSRHPWARREFLRAAGLAVSSQALSPQSLFGGALFGQAPAIVTSDRARPSNAFGVMAGDVDINRAIVWSRTDRPARLIVEYATTESFTDAKKIAGPAALDVTDYTARVDLSGLPPGQRIFYRASFQSLEDLKVTSEPVIGTFITPEAPSLVARGGRLPARDITIAWTADTVGQGWGIDTNLGGMRLYDAMRKAEPDLFVHCGDTIYADQPLLSEVKLDDGRVWKNLVTPEKSKPAETLDEYRGNHRYNLLDEHVRRFNASVSQFVLWDDHEVVDNWYPTEILGANVRHTEKSVALLAARGKRAFLEYTPIRINPEDPERIYRAYKFGPLVEVFGFDMRSYRAANSANRQPAGANGAPAEDAAILGPAQVEWLKRRLAASTATWKIIASDMPLGLVVRDGREAFEAVSNGDPGAPLGREVEIASLLAFIRERRIRNVVFITGDVHYCAAHHYDPARASFTGFNPFWEFVAGPAHAGTFGANELDKTFGPEVRFLGVPKDMKPNRPPTEGYQFFGTLKADGKTRALTAKLHNAEGKTIFTVELPPEQR